MAKRLTLLRVMLISALLATMISATSMGVASANDIALSATTFDTDIVYAGAGGMRGTGVGSLTVSGIGTGTVTQALLYWQGPTNSSDPAANATVSFDGTSITGTNIGFSSDNCWGFANSQAYRADVTSLVSGDGSYSLDNFVKPGGIDVNGVSLIVFFDDNDDTNNRDIVLFDGNDSNISNSFDADGWNVTLDGIDYSSGSVGLDLHVSDGQAFLDDSLVVNGTTIAPAGGIFQGNSVPGGELWDIKSFDVTALVNPGPNTLALTSGVNSDCLSLIVAAVNLPAGAAPPDPDEDTTAPSCMLTATGKNAEGKTYLQVTAQDTGSGIASIVVTKSTNADTVVPPFAVGTTDPIVVVATKIVQNKSSQVELRVTDVAGNVTTCDPILTVVVKDAGKPETQTFTNVPTAEGVVTITNGTKGIKNLEITVNGTTFKVTGLRDNETRSVSIASAMQPGDANTISLSARGPKGSSAEIMIWDGVQ